MATVDTIYFKLATANSGKTTTVYKGGTIGSAGKTANANCKTAHAYSNDWVSSWIDPGVSYPLLTPIANHNVNTGDSTSSSKYYYRYLHGAIKVRVTPASGKQITAFTLQYGAKSNGTSTTYQSYVGGALYYSDFTLSNAPTITGKAFPDGAVATARSNAKVSSGANKFGKYTLTFDVSSNPIATATDIYIFLWSYASMSASPTQSDYQSSSNVNQTVYVNFATSASTSYRLQFTSFTEDDLPTDRCIWHNIPGIGMKKCVPWIKVGGAWKKCVPWGKVGSAWKKGVSK